MDLFAGGLRMADIDTVLERLVTDTAFRAALTDDPAAALAPYDLSASDVELLASSLDDGDDAQRGVEQRTSKSAMIGLLASLTGGGGHQAQDLAGKKGGRYEGSVDVVVSLREAPPGAPPPTQPFTATGTGSMSEDAPPDDTAHRLPGRPKAGEIILTRTAGAGEGVEGGGQPSDVKEWGASTPQFRSSGGQAPDGADAHDGYEKWRPSSAREDLAPGGGGPEPDVAGRPNKDYATDPYVETAQRARAGEISVTRAPVADDDADGVAGRVAHEKWFPGRAGGDVAPPTDPPGDSSGDRYHDWKWVPTLREEAPPAGDVDGDGVQDIKIEIGAAGQRLPGGIPLDDSPPAQTSFNSTDAFLTVEDE